MVSPVAEEVVPLSLTWDKGIHTQMSSKHHCLWWLPCHIAIVQCYVFCMTFCLRVGTGGGGGCS